MVEPEKLEIERRAQRFGFSRARAFFLLYFKSGTILQMQSYMEQIKWNCCGVGTYSLTHSTLSISSRIFSGGPSKPLHGMWFETPVPGRNC